MERGHVHEPAHSGALIVVAGEQPPESSRVVVESRTLFPRLDDLVETQHQITSTRGTACLAAS
jgi:hypothetical protein